MARINDNSKAKIGDLNKIRVMGAWVNKIYRFGAWETAQVFAVDEDDNVWRHAGHNGQQSKTEIHVKHGTIEGMVKQVNEAGEINPAYWTKVQD
jgi:hypothetical protein